MKRVALLVALALAASDPGRVTAQETRLLRQPTLSAQQVAFAYGADLWVADRSGGPARRLTSTPAVEADPHFSPDGRWIAFTSNRSGTQAVYVVPVEGGEPTRLTWYPSATEARGWTPDGSRVLYSSTRETAPRPYERLWTVSPQGGPSTLLPAPWAHSGSYSPDGGSIVVDRMTRWDWEWRGYRGGQNTPLVVLDLDDLEEHRLPNEARTTDVQPVWVGDRIFFLSDRDWTMNVWSYDVASGDLTQVTHFTDADVKSISGGRHGLAIEHDGWIHTLDPSTGSTERLSITVLGDFPWLGTRWEDVSSSATSASLSPSGVRAVMEARGEIFTVPVENGDSRNLTRSSDTADRRPIWSPVGDEIAWFSDDGDGHELLIGKQDGLSTPRRISLGVSALGWEPVWSPDGKYIAFVDDDVRIRVVDVESGVIRTADEGGTNLERGNMHLDWSPDSKWLAYGKTYPNSFRRIVVWSLEDETATAVTDAMADALMPSWDRGGRHLYFLASTNLALGSSWASTSSITNGGATYGAYVAVLRADDPTPFPLESDEEEVEPSEDASEEPAEEDEGEDEPAESDEDSGVRVDFDGIDRRIVPLPMPQRRYVSTSAGPEGSVFIGAFGDDGPVLYKFSLEDREADVFVEGSANAAVSADGEKMLIRSGGAWRVVDTGSPPNGNGGRLDVSLRMQLDRSAEWRQIFEEAWRYEQEYFYDPGMHGNDWDDVRARYEPLVDHVRHRNDLNYLLDQVNGELSVGHSFVRGGDYPAVDTARVGLLGADLVADAGRWRLDRIYTFESWNPNLTAPLDRPGARIEEGHYLVGVSGVELTSADDPYRLLDGTAGEQTLLHINDAPTFEGSWTETVEPIRNELQLRLRAWVEDNRRRVDELSDGRLAYVWVPNTGGAGVVSFNRYFFAQQDKAGAVIDERFNGGGSLDDYMVDYMTRSLRAAITNEVPDGRPILLPGGILGPKVLLINELAGSGGDYFPWVFRQQQAGPLIGTRTWGGLVKSSTHYALVDGGSLTAPDNAVFDPANNRWIAENEGVAPDIEVLLDARSAADGRDPQLERAVEEALRLLDDSDDAGITPPPFPTPSRRGSGQR